MGCSFGSSIFSILALVLTINHVHEGLCEQGWEAGIASSSIRTFVKPHGLGMCPGTIPSKLDTQGRNFIGAYISDSCLQWLIHVGGPISPAKTLYTLLTVCLSEKQQVRYLHVIMTCGSLTSQMQALANAVVIAKVLNATLVIPYLQSDIRGGPRRG